MARLLYCRHQDCHEAYVSDAGKQPAICPACQRAASWTAIPPHGIRPAAHPDDPKRPYDLTLNDRRFLRSLRIETDSETCE